MCDLYPSPVLEQCDCGVLLHRGNDCPRCDPDADRTTEARP